MTRTARLLLLTLAVPTFAAAGELGRDHHELRRDRAEIRGDKAALADDIRDYRHMEALLHEFDRARGVRDFRAVKAVEVRVALALREEFREAKRETREARGELRQSRQETREERHEVLRDADQARPARYADDRHDLRDDRRDQRDDRADLAREKRYRKRVNAIRVQWTSRLHDRSHWAMDQKRAMLQELVQLAHDEVRATADELHEDRAERREDRRELREDRRERRWD
ncbi:MAG TPA: hypothetical protein VEB43_21450 [Anaeromyxobacter sp.]|nr:hypothetical protein [Anaeromyxobacter sp.]